MNEIQGRRKPTAMFLIKLLIVLSFPLQGIFSSPYFGWISILLIVGGSPFVTFTSLFSVLTGLVILLPCMIFEYQLNSRPIDKSMRWRAAGASILSWLISIFLSNIIGFDPYLYYALDFTFILSIAFYVVLPLISRETALRSISTEHKTLSYSFITSSIRKRFKRERVLSGLLWAGLIFSPFVFYVDTFWWNTRLFFMSLFFQYDITSGYSVLSGLELSLPLEIQFSSWPAYGVPFLALLSVIRFVFVRDLFRFKLGLTTNSRLLAVSILGEILPSAAITFTSLPFAFYGDYMPLILPFPILPLIGFVFIRLTRIVPMREELWLDYEHRMWYEKEHVPYTPEPKDETIKVPVTYLLVSQVRKRLKE